MERGVIEMRKIIIGTLIIMMIFAGCGGEEAPETTEPPATTMAPTTMPPTTAPPVTTPPPTPGPGAYFADPHTELSILLPSGVDKIKDLTDQDYFALKLPTKTAGYDSGIKGIYVTPTGTIYIMKFKSVEDTDFFFEAMVQKLATQNERLEPKTLILEGNPQEIHHRYRYNEYLGTYIKKGVFIYFLTFNINEFGVEDFILANMEDVFLDVGHIETGATAVVTKKVDFSSTSTWPEDVLPAGGTTESLSSSVYKYDLKFPDFPQYDAASSGTYSLPAGKIVVLRYRSEADSSTFLQEVKDKIARGGSHMIIEDSLTKDGKTLPISIKRTVGGTYTATLVQKGLFVIYIEMGANEFEAENYIEQNMPYLFE